MESKRTCVTCKIEKELNQFYKCKKYKDGYNTRCRDCTNESSKKSYFRTSGKRNKYLVDRRKRIKEEFENNLIQAKIKCIKCGFDHPAALDFHHRDPSQKLNTIGDLKWAGASKERMQKELDKCDVLCANCHRILHYNEKRKK